MTSSVLVMVRNGTEVWGNYLFSGKGRDCGVLCCVVLCCVVLCCVVWPQHITFTELHIFFEFLIALRFTAAHCVFCVQNCLGVLCG